MEQTVSKQQQIADWKRAVEELNRQVEAWAADLGWPTARQKKVLHERALGSYEVADLSIKTPSGVMILDVKARDVVNADGRVDLYLLHNLNRILLVRKGEGWLLKTDTGVRWPKPWNKDTFAELPALVSSAA
jgi:hypothetical protein